MAIVRCDAATGGYAVGGHAAGKDATDDCCDSCNKLPGPIRCIIEKN
jgi:hypothetical protein